MSKPSYGSKLTYTFRILQERRGVYVRERDGGDRETMLIGKRPRVNERPRVDERDCVSTRDRVSMKDRVSARDRDRVSMRDQETGSVS